MVNLHRTENLLTLQEFKITGLFGELEHTISFPMSQADEPEILILVGRNGIGKTTILNLLSGLLTLNFVPFMRVPFRYCQLRLSNGDCLFVESQRQPKSLLIGFNDLRAIMTIEPRDSERVVEKIEIIELIRQTAAPVLNRIHFELVNIHRLIADMQTPWHPKSRSRAVYNGNGYELSNLVRQFITEAQVNSRKYFSADEIDFLPRLLKKVSSKTGGIEVTDLLTRLDNIRAQLPQMNRLGFQIDSHDLDWLSQWLRETDTRTTQNEPIQAALEAYVEMLESQNEVLSRIATRLLRFEAIMDEFMIGKTVRVDAERGLKIETKPGDEIKEIQLSSGEYYFLYMMVIALVSHRFGTIIAVDEPENSLHVSWQRKLIRVLCECASGASPLFLLATHSSAIGAEFQDKWVYLG